MFESFSTVGGIGNNRGRSDYCTKLVPGPVHLIIHRQRPNPSDLQQWFLCTVVTVPWFTRSRSFRSPPILLFLFANF
jgi:hypothetical protein